MERRWPLNSVFERNVAIEMLWHGAPPLTTLAELDSPIVLFTQKNPAQRQNYSPIVTSQ